MHHKFKRYFSRVLWIPVTLSILLMILSVSGCLSQQEITYQDRVGKLIDRYYDLEDNTNKLMKDFALKVESLLNSIPNTDPAEFISRWDQIIDAYVPQFQQYLAAFQQLQTDLANINPPEKYSAAHSIFNSGLSSTVSSLNVLFEGIDQARSSNLAQEGYFKVEELSASMNNFPSFLEQGLKNMETGKNMIYEPDWGLIVGVILGVFAIVGGVIVFFVYISRKRRYQPGYHAGSPAIATPYPSTGYPPPPIDYGPPSEAYRQSPPGDIHPAPPIQYQPQQPAGPVPSATKPQTSPQAVRCPRCGAEVTAAGPFCPSCGAMLPGV